MTLVFMVTMPAISMAPQNDIYSGKVQQAASSLSVRTPHLAVTLGEVQVAEGKFGTRYVNGKVASRPSAKLVGTLNLPDRLPSYREMFLICTRMRRLERDADRRWTGETNIVVPSMLTRRDRAGALPLDLLEDLGTQVLADVHALRLRREGHGRHRAGVRVDELLLALVPLGEQLRVRRTADEAGVRDAGKADARDMTRGGVDA
jgi:hypothetical protein